MKNLKGKSLLVFLSTIFMLVFILKDDFSGVINIIKTTNLLWIVVGILVYYFGLFIQAISLKQIINQYNKDYSLLETFKLNIIVKFFNAITPLVSGGQPFQVYELHTNKIKLVVSTFVFISGSFIPIPGGTGGVEYVFFEFFGYFVAGASLMSILLIWRFVTFILPVLLGGILFNLKKVN